MENIEEFEEKIENLIRNKEYERALEILDKTIADSTDPKVLTLCFIEKANIMGALKDPHKMEIYIYNAVNVFYDIEDPAYRGKMALHIGGLFLFLGDTYNALKFYREAVELLPPDSYDHVRALYNIGEVQKRMGDLHSAKEKFSTCYSKAKVTGRREIEVYAAENLAEIFMMEGNPEEAKVWLEKAKESLKHIEDKRIRHVVELAFAIMDGDEEKIEEISTLMKNMGMEHDIADTYYYYSDFTNPELRERLLKEAALIFSDLGDGRMHALTVKKLNR